MGAGERRRRGGFGHRSRGFGHRRGGRAVGRIELKNKNMRAGCCLMFGSFCCCLPGIPLLVLGVAFAGINTTLMIAGAALLGVGLLVIIVGCILCTVGSKQPADVPQPAPGVEGGAGQQAQGADGAPAAAATTTVADGQGQQPPPYNNWGGANPAGMTGAPPPPSYNATVYGTAPGSMPQPPGVINYNQPASAAYPPPAPIQA